MEEKKYLIIALRYWGNSENVLFWGKNSSGYYTDLSKVGLYTKEEAVSKSKHGDCYINMDTLGITEEMLNFSHESVKMVFPKNTKICKYANTFEQIMKNKRNLKYGA
ncbi:hypothetical protein [Niameybacter massiliensis]|uniref:hypothetical protein n=1 Tax=Niameybacter massiliensis TaxID=1658108 RepID=UPI0006B6666C|nr:hypothetical protein [Niameybacter massiliensis]